MDSTIWNTHGWDFDPSQKRGRTGLRRADPAGYPHPRGKCARRYQLKMGLNVTEQANCQANGFHCAANPMDCLRYYGDFQNSEYYLVRPCGDLDEDAVDSRISCTQLWVLRKLEPQEFFLHALAYMADHPQMPDGCDVKRERAQAWNGYAVVRGKHPRAKGKLGDILAFAREAVNGPKIEHLSLCVIDGKERLPDVWYDDNFKECEAA